MKKIKSSLLFNKHQQQKTPTVVYYGIYIPALKRKIVCIRVYDILVHLIWLCPPLFQNLPWFPIINTEKIHSFGILEFRNFVIFDALLILGTSYSPNTKITITRTVNVHFILKTVKSSWMENLLLSKRQIDHHIYSINKSVSPKVNFWDCFFFLFFGTIPNQLCHQTKDTSLPQQICLYFDTITHIHIYIYEIHPSYLFMY